MITEFAVLYIKENESHLFENAFGEAQKIISKMTVYIGHELQKCIEEKNKYILIVGWKSIVDHTGGFRKSEEYGKWKSMLHHFYDPFPVESIMKKCINKKILLCQNRNLH